VENVRHRMLVPLQFVNRGTPPSDPQPGDSYFDTGLLIVRTWDGTKWSGGLDEVAVRPDTPPGSGYDLWVDTDEVSGRVGGYSGGGGGGNVLVVSDVDRIPPGTPPGTVIVVSAGAPEPVAAPGPVDLTSPIVVGTAEASNSNSILLTVGRPHGVADGDYLLAVVADQSVARSTDILPGAGFTRVGAPFTAAGPNDRYLAVFGKRVLSAAGEPDEYTFDFTGPGDSSTSKKLVSVLAVRGVGAAAVEGFTAPSSAIVPHTDNQFMVEAVPSAGGTLGVVASHLICTAGNRGTAALPSPWVAVSSVEQGDWAVASSSALTVSVRTVPRAETVGGEILTATGPVVATGSHCVVVVNGV
jgi:hypothetical protein